MAVETINPAIPTSMGALVAEEVTMNPFTPLPSFLEMVMMEETSGSAQRALQTCMDAVVEQAAAVANSPSADSESSSSSGRTATFLSWAKARGTIARFVEYVGRHHGPEMRLFVTYLIERQCLKSKACATFSESIFGARRAKLGATRRVVSNDKKIVVKQKLLPISDRDKTRLALLVALGPYVKERFDKLFERLYQERQEYLSASNGSATDDSSRLFQRLRSLFISLYPFLHMTHEGTMLFYQWSFLVGRSLFFNPSSHWLGLVVRRVTSSDLSSAAGKGDGDSSRGKSDSGASSSDDPTRKALIRQLRTVTATGISGALMLGWISQLRNEIRRRRRQLYLEQHHGVRESSLPPTQNDGEQTVLSIPPPMAPSLHTKASDRIRPLPSNQSLCPLCHQPRINPAASTSGHVFCHRCLVMYVREHGTCPLTGRDCPESRIVRIYEPQSVSRRTD
mmetsp:Transcript_26264/g.40277  ORF Transcript_26264/g.40277 Transcript_26264/m.40277 type:complete len:452 (+) Transcript_26264:17-1372(+)